MIRKNTKQEIEEIIRVRRRNPNKYIYYNYRGNKYKFGWICKYINYFTEKDYPEHRKELFFSLKKPKAEVTYL